MKVFSVLAIFFIVQGLCNAQTGLTDEPDLLSTALTTAIAEETLGPSEKLTTIEAETEAPQEPTTAAAETEAPPEVTATPEAITSEAPSNCSCPPCPIPCERGTFPLCNCDAGFFGKMCEFYEGENCTVTGPIPPPDPNPCHLPCPLCPRPDKEDHPEVPKKHDDESGFWSKFGKNIADYYIKKFAGKHHHHPSHHHHSNIGEIPCTGNGHVVCVPKGPPHHGPPHHGPPHHGPPHHGPPHHGPTHHGPPTHGPPHHGGHHGQSPPPHHGGHGSHPPPHHTITPPY